MLLKVIIMKSIVFNNCHVDIRAERIFKAGVGAFWFYDGKLYYNEELADNFKLVTKVADPAVYVETVFKKDKEYKIICRRGRLEVVEVKKD